MRKKLSNILLCFVIFEIRNCEATTEIKSTDSEHAINGTEVTKGLFNSERKYIRKCCPLKQYAFVQNSSINCLPSPEKHEIDIKVYNQNHEPIEKNAENTFNFLSGNDFIKKINGSVFVVGEFYDEKNILLLENTTLVLDNEKSSPRWTSFNIDDYCVDEIEFEGSFFFDILLETAKPPSKLSEPKNIGMFVSSVCLLLTLTVYALLPELRNLGGMILMAYCSCMLVGSTLNAVIHSIKQAQKTDEFCHSVAMITYFSTLATYFWMNVMSFDIWWVFRGIVHSRAVNRRGEKFKFMMYCLYGFGAPLGITTIMAILNYLPEGLIDETISPGMGYKDCYITAKQLIYWLQIPTAVILIANCSFFVATTLNVLEVRRFTKTLAASNAAEGRQKESAKRRFYLYVKLFLVMGVNSTWEVVSALVDTSAEVWIVTDLINALTGFFIFIIFVCKRKVYKLLKLKYNRMRGRSPPESRQRGTLRSRSVPSSGSCSSESSLVPEGKGKDFVSLKPV